MNPPAAAGAAGGGGVGLGETGVIGPNELVASGAGSFGFGSWFSACSNCVNPPAAAGACGGAAGDGDVENRSPLSGAGSCFNDFSGSSCAGAPAPWLENICVNAPGPDGAVGAPGFDSETWEGGVGGVGAGETGPLAPGVENMRVNSPGPDFGATWGAGGGVGEGETGPELIGAPAPGVENIRVNSPGADCDATCGAGGAGAGETGVLAGASLGAFAFIELNIRVKAPGPALSVFPAPLPAMGTPTVGSMFGFSMATGLKTRATSSVFPEGGAALFAAPASVPGVVSACSMRVKSPGPREVSGCAGGAATGSFAGSDATGPHACGGAWAAAGGGGAAGSFSGAFFCCAPCPSSDASKSSSARGGAATCPKIPVALDG
ncbi:MAG TPA: hypothetical protein VGS10_17505 [Terracidiphilus sp.]|nr:hypothetical protein [Terracidiphilus sp.]